ncbi:MULTISPECIES: 1-deoxy-D-xylulose-5-phosphate synthase [Corynebacterium]|uniref:1-deoxy-D-xylulose-5-phosphate synthase n=1 Tax=Corynebacterium TaxID=1716 RepID=UPI00124F1D54|nr:MULTISPECIES: 1-deoxy-D-xylulose-5-phosphate synthase [Corynebacterium]
MGFLEHISTPDDVKALTIAGQKALAREIREFLIQHVSQTGGHLGPNLGVVELTIGLHYVFNSPHDPLIFDTSHQSYVHKMLTGRRDDFDTLRQKGGLSGYTDRGESEHDWTESSHASASISVADGLSKAFTLQGDTDRCVVAVVGDGALTGGMCWEALNNVAADNDRNLVIVVNDNGRSYSPTIGGFANNLAELRMQPFYDRVMEQGKSTLKNMGWVGRRAFTTMHAVKEGLKDAVLPTVLFPEMGIKYVGPVDGHDQEQVNSALKYAKEYDKPVIVHMVTEKGRGYAPAEANVADLMHSTGAIDPTTGEPLAKSAPGWTKIFSEELIKAGQERTDIVAITAAMAGPTGLAEFGEMFPDRFFDVGIAEQHATTSAAGLALGGTHPVVAIYSTFLNRAFDQLLMDVALLKQPATFVLDRAGVTGSDGPSHNGVWDMAVTGIVPGLRLAAPRDAQQLREQFREALDISDGPTVVRFPKGARPPQLDAVGTLSDGVDVLRYHDDEHNDAPKVLFIAVGPMAHAALDAARALEEEGVSTMVVDPRWVIPVPASLIGLAADHDLVVTIEDGVAHGGVGSSIAQALNAAEVDVPTRHAAVPQRFLLHASRNEIMEEIGLDANGIAASTRGWLDGIGATVSGAESPESGIEADPVADADSADS